MPVKLRTNFRRPFTALLFTALTFPALEGCLKSHTIQPGIWRLSIEAQKEDPESWKYARKPRDVDLTVDWGTKKTEVVKIRYESKTETGTKPRELKGKIDGTDIVLEGYDQDWVIWLKGVVNGPRSMNGTAFGRGRLNDKAYFNGTWTLVKVQEE